MQGSQFYKLVSCRYDKDPTMDCPFILTFGIKAPKTDEEKSSERIPIDWCDGQTSPSNLKIHCCEMFHHHSTIVSRTTSKDFEILYFNRRLAEMVSLLHS